MGRRKVTLVSERWRKTVNYLLYSLFHSLLCKHRDASIGTVGIAIYKLPTGPCRRQLREEGGAKCQLVRD